MKSHMIVICVTVSFMRCSVRAPEISVTGEKTALESQVLGTYQQIESDAFVIASTREFGGQRATISTQKQEVLEAVQNRKFNRDDIEELKKARVLGENNRGYLEIRPNERYQQDADYRRIVEQITDEENHDRQVIYERIIAINQMASQADPQQLEQIYARINAENSEAGTLIQLPNGQWLEKKNR